MESNNDISPNYLEIFEMRYIEPIKEQMKKDCTNIVKFALGIDQMMCPLDDRRNFE